MTLGILGVHSLIVASLAWILLGQGPGLDAASAPGWPASVHIPSDALLHNVKDYGAKGDGITDDTAAIRRGIAASIGDHQTLFFPAGIYSISGSLPWKDKQGTYNAFLTWQGEGSGRTIIRLRDHCPGFGDPARPASMTSSGSIGVADGSGNRAHNNFIFDMTFDTGSGNPGAIGVDFNASNTGSMHRVRIRSGDGAGVAGLSMTREVGPCLIKHLEVIGFDDGVLVGNLLYGITMEDISLKDQRHAGIHNTGSMLAIRHLSTVDTVSAVLSEVWSSMTVILDADLTGGAPGIPAIVNHDSTLVLQRIHTVGYGDAVQGPGKPLRGPDIADLVQRADFTVPAFTAFPCRPRMLSLAGPDAPEWNDQDPAHWANVATFGAKPGGKDASTGVQRAIDSGATTVYFPVGSYTFGHPVIVRGKVRRILGFQAGLEHDSIFRCENNRPVKIERFNFWSGGVINAASAPVGLIDVLGPTISATPGPRIWFFEDVCTAPIAIGPGQKLYAGQLNCEKAGPPPMITNDGGLVWILGYKTEFGNTVLSTLHGGRSEICGGLFYPAQGFKDPSTPALINDASSVSASFNEISFGSHYQVEIREVRQGKVGKILHSGPHGILGQTHTICPLYVGTP